MTKKQKIFADEYLIDLNATRAYKVAYPNVKNDVTAAAAASRLLRNVKVQEYIAQRMAEKESKRIADQDEVLKYLTSVLRGESTAQEIVVEGTGDGCSEARTMEKAPSEKERLKAAELLGKRYALFTDKVDMDTDMDLNKARYFQGYLTELDQTSSAEDNVELSLTFGLEGKGVKGYATVTAEQQEVAAYVFADTQKTGA